jgi:hypothetical protein
MDFNIHNVEADFHEFIDSTFEFGLNILDVGGHLLSFGVTNLNLLELVKLLDSASQVHDILASFREGVEADEKSISGNLPLVLTLSFVVKVGLLETSTNSDAKLETSVGFIGNFSSNRFLDAVTINVGVAIQDNLVANLTDEYNKPSGGVVVAGIGPDHENSVHDRDKSFLGFNKLNTSVHKLTE